MIFLRRKMTVVFWHSNHISCDGSDNYLSSYVLLNDGGSLFDTQGVLGITNSKYGVGFWHCQTLFYENYSEQFCLSRLVIDSYIFLVNPNHSIRNHKLFMMIKYIWSLKYMCAVTLGRLHSRIQTTYQCTCY